MLDRGSLSFERFTSLSWERRSVFTRNKYQEEVEKFKSPGLVAKKKAYFEEYYKRTRAIKDSQENQQTELTLDYDGNESISSQNEEEETTMYLENLGEAAANIVDDNPEKATVEISTEKEIIEVQNRNSDTETTNLGSPGSNSEDLEHECYPNYPLDLEEASVEISMEKVKETLEVLSLNSDQETTTVSLDSMRSNSEDLEQEVSTMYPLQVQQLDIETPDKISFMRTIEVTEQHDLSYLDKEDVSGDKSITHIEPEGFSKSTEISKSTELYSSNSKSGDLELKPAKKLESEKVASHVRSHRVHALVHKVKVPSAAGGNGSKLEGKTKPGIVKPSEELKYASQRTTKKSANFPGSSRLAADDSRKYKSFSTPSHKPLTEVRSTVTIPCPFSFATDRRATVVHVNREGPLKSDTKASCKRTYVSVHKKDVMDAQGRLKRSIATAGVQSRELENKRGHEKRKKPLPLDRLHVSLKDKGADVPERPKTRSVNLLSRNKYNSSNGTVTRNKGPRADMQKEEKSEERLRVVRRTVAKVACPPAGPFRSETKKVVPSYAGKRSISGRKSLDVKKPRQEKPPWR